MQQLYSQINPLVLALLASLLALLCSVLANKRVVLFFTLITLCLQTLALFMRGFIAHRAPITNMYETVFFSGYSALIIMLLYYYFNQKKSFFLLVGLTVNSLCLMMINLATNMLDSKIAPLPPVLRNNFWLLIHVIPTIIAFAAFALSWCLANIYMLQSIIRRSIYHKSFLCAHCDSTIKIGTIFLLVGIVTGAIWADYTWGRFWSWDPKETWALIVLLVYMGIIHCKYTMKGGLSETIFIALVASAFLSVIVAWFGVNYILNSGLHSYGFSSGGTAFVILFFMAQLIITFSYLFFCYYRPKKLFNHLP
ncbi:MAG: cytochrome c biogenesis protein CcsA [Oligoflexia bacterium]|nr:cytochrome c biogenesis protein CcsA [Oligoflexia bacterium]